MPCIQGRIRWLIRRGRGEDRIYGQPIRPAPPPDRLWAFAGWKRAHGGVGRCRTGVPPFNHNDRYTEERYTRRARSTTLSTPSTRSTTRAGPPTASNPRATSPTCAPRLSPGQQSRSRSPRRRNPGASSFLIATTDRWTSASSRCRPTFRFSGRRRVESNDAGDGSFAVPCCFADFSVLLDSSPQVDIVSAIKHLGIPRTPDSLGDDRAESAAGLR
jgi:hypothetical protein